MSPLQKMLARNDNWSLLQHCFNSVVASVAHCTRKAIICPNILIIHFFKFFQKLAIKISLSLYYYSLWTQKSAKCDIAFHEFVFWHAKKVVLQAYVKLLIWCLTIPAWPVQRKITQDWKSFSHSKWCKKFFIGKKSPISSKKVKFRNAKKIINISESTKFHNLLNTSMLRYLRKVQHISGEFLWDMPNDLPHIFCCDWNFSPRVNPRRTMQTNMASNWPDMSSCKKIRNNS